MSKKTLFIALLLPFICQLISCTDSAVPNEKTAIEIAIDYIEGSMYEAMSPYFEAVYLPEQEEWLVRTPTVYVEDQSSMCSIELFIGKRDGNVNNFNVRGGTVPIMEME